MTRDEALTALDALASACTGNAFGSARAVLEELQEATLPSEVRGEYGAVALWWGSTRVRVAPSGDIHVMTPSRRHLALTRAEFLEALPLP